MNRRRRKKKAAKALQFGQHYSIGPFRWTSKDLCIQNLPRESVNVSYEEMEYRLIDHEDYPVSCVKKDTGAE